MLSAVVLYTLNRESNLTTKFPVTANGDWSLMEKAAAEISRITRTPNAAPAEVRMARILTGGPRVPLPRVQ